MVAGVGRWVLPSACVPGHLHPASHPLPSSLTAAAMNVSRLTTVLRPSAAFDSPIPGKGVWRVNSASKVGNKQKSSFIPCSSSISMNASEYCTVMLSMSTVGKENLARRHKGETKRAYQGRASGWRARAASEILKVKARGIVGATYALTRRRS